MVSAGGSGSGGALCGPSGGGFLHLCSTWLGCRLLPHLIYVLGEVAGSGSDNGVVCFYRGFGYPTYPTYLLVSYPVYLLPTFTTLPCF